MIPKISISYKKRIVKVLIRRIPGPNLVCETHANSRQSSYCYNDGN